MQRHFSHDAMTQSFLLFVECCELSSRGRALFYRHYVCFLCQILNLESTRPGKKIKRDLLAFLIALNDSSGRQAVTHRLIVLHDCKALQCCVVSVALCL